MQQGLGVGEGVPRRNGHKTRQIDALPGGERTVQLKALAVVATESEAPDRAHPESDQVVEHSTRGPRQAPNPGDVVHRQPGLDGDLGSSRIDIEIPIEAEVSEQCHP
jgi:hypothetical protein